MKIISIRLIWMKNYFKIQILLFKFVKIIILESSVIRIKIWSILLILSMILQNWVMLRKATVLLICKMHLL